MKTWESIISEHHTGTLADDLVDYGGYVCDAISELADSNVSIYTADQIDFALNNTEITGRAVNEFGLTPSDDFGAYVAQAGAMGWYYQNQNEIYENLEDGMTLCVIYALRKARNGEPLTEGAWEHVIDSVGGAWDDSSARIEDITEEAVSLYNDWMNAHWSSPDVTSDLSVEIIVLD